MLTLISSEIFRVLDSTFLTATFGAMFGAIFGGVVTFFSNLIFGVSTEY